MKCIITQLCRGEKCRRPPIVQEVWKIDGTSFFPSSLKPLTFLDIDKIFKTTYTGRDYIGKTLIHQRFFGFLS
jgi:hypothetical protein